MKNILTVIILSLQLTACAAEIGSDSWCANLKDTPKSEWSMVEIKDYAKHCFLK